MSSIKLTDKLARTLEPGIHFDRDPRSPAGFLVRVTKAGARAWCLNYRVRDTGRERRITIGDIKSWPIAEARKRAHELKRLIDIGGDPLADLEEARSAPTVTQLIERFTEKEMPRRASTTQREYRAMLADWIMPALARRKVADIDRSDIEKLHRHVTAGAGPRRGNMVKSLTSVLFNCAIRWEWRDPHTNPCEMVEGNVEHARERYLGAEEIARLIGELEERRATPRWHDSVDTILLALLTGARLGEILTAEWDQFDLETGVWTKPAGLTKQRRVHRVPLSVDAVELLRRRHAGATRSLRRVFRRGESGRSGLNRDWRMIRAAAGLSDVRFHDLRHSFASMLVGEGLSLPIIGRMLGHSRPATTARYAHLADQPLRDAAEMVAKRVRGR